MSIETNYFRFFVQIFHEIFIQSFGLSELELQVVTIILKGVHYRPFISKYVGAVHPYTPTNTPPGWSLIFASEDSFFSGEHRF